MLQRLFRSKSTNAVSAPSAQPQPIIIVSGLPRSGTSMMMKILEAGGLAVLTDALRTADDDNPRGYYEYERVKQLDQGDVAWLATTQGKVVKVISALLPHLPATYPYRVIFMQRKMAEVLASQRKMLANRGEQIGAAEDAVLTTLFEKHLQATKAWLQNQPHITVLNVDYNQMVVAPTPYLQAINHFLDDRLDLAQMARAIDPTLHRNRADQ